MVCVCVFFRSVGDRAYVCIRRVRAWLRACLKVRIHDVMDRPRVRPLRRQLHIFCGRTLAPVVCVYAFA